MVEAVVAARRQHLTVKMPGNGHSFTDVAVTDGLMLRPGSLRGIVAGDAECVDGHRARGNAARAS